MLRAGLPVLNTLEMLAAQTSRPPMKKIIETIKKDLESGNALSKCFEKHTKIFGATRWSETTGCPSALRARMALMGPSRRQTWVRHQSPKRT